VTLRSRQLPISKQAPDDALDGAVAMSRDAMRRDDDDRTLRAGGVLRQLVLHPAAWMAGWFVGDELRGVIRASHAAREACAEANLFVDREWRRQGIGTMLLKEGMDWARRREASSLRLVCDRTDWPMRHFAKKFGAGLDLVLGQIIVNIPLRVQQ
jgi:GNAT superfamily N-acetyltransferase